MKDRKSQILDAAISLFLSEGVGVSTARIAKAAGVSNGTLFNVFATKQDLIDEIYLKGKKGMFEALPNGGSAPFDHTRLKENWDGYLSWAEANPALRRAMHMLFEAGLASEEAKAEGAKLAAPQGEWFARAYAAGVISGPNIEYISKVASMQLELVISLELAPPEAEEAFGTLCKTLDLASGREIEPQQT